MRSKNTGAHKALENVIHLIFLLCGIVAVGFVLVISVYLILSGLPAIRQIGLFKFLFGKVWDPTNTTTGAQYGILPFILTSIYGTAGAMVIGVPIGLMTAIFLSKLAPPRAAAVPPMPREEVPPPVLKTYFMLPASSDSPDCTPCRPASQAPGTERVTMAGCWPMSAFAARRSGSCASLAPTRRKKSSSGAIGISGSYSVR